MKAILLVRVSAITQSLDEQTLNLIDYSISKGYNKEDLIILEDKESAIKLSEDERNGLNQMKTYIDKDSSINAVFVWELSRLTRIPSTAYSLRDFFNKNNIQLFCYSPQFQLLKSDLSDLDDNGSLLFALYIQMAESEIRNKKARFHRSKVRNARTGKYSGGFIKYGYKVNDRGFYEINEDEASLIKYVFDEYEKGSSIIKLNKELLSRGVIDSDCFVAETLKCEAYTGLSNLYGMNRKYPQIISTEQYNAVQRLKKRNNKNADKTKNIYFAKGLIKCACCGQHYMGMKSSIQYLCYNKFGREVKLERRPKCIDSANININLLDSLLWRLAKFSEALRTNFINIIEKEKLEQNININNQFINESKSAIKKYNNRKERIADNYMDGIINKSKRDEKIKEVDFLINDANNFIAIKQTEIRKANEILRTKFKAELSDDEEMDNWKNEITNKRDKLNLLDDDNEKYEIIKRNIIEVNILEEEKNKTKIVVVKYYNDKVERYRINIKKKPATVEYNIFDKENEFEDFDEGYSKQLHEDFDDNLYLPIHPPLEITQRFIRKSK